jgi:Relaxase/Mobilisation nuclease domain
MIVKISASGKSFSGLATYLTHDTDKALTADRVDWAHTHNLANDFVPAAVDEMLWTTRDAELLKQEAGVRAGGRSVETPVKHVSLNWKIGANPSQQHMISTAEHFLRSMGWEQHQAIFIAHNDKPYKHVHLMINQVHPETGLQLNDGFEKVRASKWGKAYELEQGRIDCPQRLLNAADREKAMPRNMWLAFQKNEREFEKFEKTLSENAEIPEYHPNNRKGEEWKILKEIQRDERTQFFADGKTQYSELRSSIYREVRQEFRERWSDYYSARKNGTEADPNILADVKAKLIADQKAVLEPRRDAACAELKEARALEYRGILDKQRETRAELGWRLEMGLDNAPFFHDLTERQNAHTETRSAFRAAAQETTDRSHLVEASPGEQRETGGSPARETEFVPAVRHRVGAGAISFLDALFFDVVNIGSPPKTSEPWPGERNEFEVAAEEATKHAQRLEREAVDAEWGQRQKAIRGE